VNLTDATNAAIADNQGEGTIENDDAMPSITIEDVSLAEGHSGTTDFTFTMTLSTAAGVDVTVDHATADDTATAGSDYTAHSNTATIPAGSTTATVTIDVTGDMLIEPHETFFVNLSGAANATLADPQALGTILHDDGAAGITIDDVSLEEGDAGTTDFVFTLSLSAPVGDDVTIQYSTADDTAAAGSDYTAESDVATIPAGSTSTTITIDVTGDLTFEDDETFFVNLTGSTNASITDNQGTGTIENDDDAPTADLSISKTTTATTFTPGQEVTYTLTVHNDGPLEATSVTVTDELPAGASFVSASGDGATCIGTTTVTCTIPTLADDATVVITLVIVATGDDPISNTATVSALSPADGAPGNNEATAVISPAALAEAQVPTLSEWALMLLAALLAAVALRRT
jgi:uncharacterized repeat protein (TIGR01451 family)